MKNFEREMVRLECAAQKGQLRALPSSSHLAPTMTTAWWAVLKHVPGFWLIPAVLFEDDREPSCLDELLIIGSGLK